MASLNDITYSTLGDLGYTGSLTDRVAAFWGDLGIYGNDARLAYMVANGGTGDSYNDIAKSFYEGGGGAKLFTSSTGANGEKVFTVLNSSGDAIKHVMYDVSTTTTGATNTIDSSYFSSNVRAVTATGKNTRTGAAIVSEINSVGVSSYVGEWANTQDVSNSGPQRVILMGDA